LSEKKAVTTEMIARDPDGGSMRKVEAGFAVGSTVSRPVRAQKS
jgi:hypothetical protein